MPKKPTTAKKTPTTAVNPFGWTAPKPKGPNPGPITRSKAWTPAVASSAIDDAEASAFRRSSGDIGAVMPLSRRNRLVSDAALEGRGLSPAQLRMQNQPVIGDEGDDERDNEEPEDVQEDQGEAAPFKMPPVATMEMVQQPTCTSHPADAYEQANTTKVQPARPDVPTLPNGTIVHRASGLSIAKVSVEDVDRLWDWIRHDADGGTSFLWQKCTTSIALHQYLLKIDMGESNGIAAIRAIHGGDQHLGFAMLAPILEVERTALMHIYLREDMRGHLATIAGPLVEMASTVVPDMHLAVWSSDERWARLHRKLLAPLGFTERTMFIR